MTSETSMCGPGWYQVGSSCFRFIMDTMNWATARLRCLKEKSILATFDHRTLNSLSAKVRNFSNSNRILYTGLKGLLTWQWLNGDEMLSNLWGPGEPSGKEDCGSFLNARSWNKAWNGWRWNDVSCSTMIGFICQETKSKHKYLHV